MRSAAGSGQVDLFLPLRKPGLLFIGRLVVALRATHALEVVRRFPVRVLNGAPARPAEVVFTNLKTMANGDAFIKDETLPLPEALLFRDPFEVLENTPLKVIDLLDPCVLEHRR